MKFTLAALSLASVAFGASQSALIPSGISAGCTNFLQELNSDANIQACINPLIAATESFSPTSTNKPSSAQVSSVLDKVCAQGSGCSESTLRASLTKFQAACGTELNQGNKDVLNLYDVLYVTYPLQQAVCSKPNENSYCVLTIAAANKAPAAAPGNNKVLIANEPSFLSLAQTNLVTFLKRQFERAVPQANSFASIVTPNATTYQSTNLPFLFLQPTMSKDKLCTPCTAKVFTAYISWESKLPYSVAGGLNKSPILGGQTKLYSAINSTCGAVFTAGIETGAGAGAVAQNGAFQRAGASVVATVAAGLFVLAFAA